MVQQGAREYRPYLFVARASGGFAQALDKAQAPLRTFMFKHTREKDLSIFYSISKMEAPRSKEEVPTMLLAAAYRRLNLAVLRESVFLTAKTSAMVCWLFVGSAIFSAAFAINSVACDCSVAESRISVVL